MYKTVFILLFISVFTCLFGVTDTIQQEAKVIKTNDMVFCRYADTFSVLDNRNTISVGYVISPETEYYLISVPIVYRENIKLPIKSKLVLYGLSGNKYTLELITQYKSFDYKERVQKYFYLRPAYYCDKKTMTKISNDFIIGFTQEFIVPIKKKQSLYKYWFFSEVLLKLKTDIDKQHLDILYTPKHTTYESKVKKKKTQNADGILFNNGQYTYVQGDSITKTKRDISFSESFMY